MGYSFQLSVISYQLSVISYQLSVISYQLSVISYQLSVISYQLSVISYQLSVILKHRSNFCDILTQKKGFFKKPFFLIAGDVNNYCACTCWLIPELIIVRKEYQVQELWQY
ncbi:hypothetical protein B1L04_15970 [Microcystis aeruginosa KW]|uniref:Uncharacterized protein n=1 Tax=Microcystis aeruginosa KW TaxID=1960155 RepID=A0A1V4BSM2_MICAE|nr:hypothetical protein B1L04_15970 [Microcystis aeruginosa KW]